MSDDYYKNLPVKRMAVGVLILNAQREMLIVKPSYRDHWLLPGGVVEKNESLKEACMREVAEEVGLAITPLRLLSIDYMPDTDDGRGESLQIMFYGGIAEASQIKPDGKEIMEARFLPLEQAMELVSENTRRRLPHGFSAIEQGAVYLEGGALAC